MQALGDTPGVGSPIRRRAGRSDEGGRGMGETGAARARGWAAAMLAALFALTTAPSPAAANAPETDPRATAPVVYAGVYLRDIASIDLREGAFDAHFDLWIRWAGAAAAIPPLEIVNAELSTFDEVARESVNGWNAVRWTVRGEFRNRFSVAEFPFDRLPVEVRLRLDQRAGRLEPDLAASGAETSFSAAGWLYEPYFEARAGALAFASDFGSVADEGAQRRMDEVSFILTMERPRVSIALRYLPLFIVVVVAAVALWTPPEKLEIASGLIVTSLLASIAFYFAEAGGLPDVPYLTRAHILFLGAYLLILAALGIAFLSFFLRRRPRLASAIGRLASVGILAAAALGALWFQRPVPDAAAAGARPAASADAADPRPAADRRTAEPEVAITVAGLGDRLNFDIYASVLSRGVVGHSVDGAEIPHLLEKRPALTNELVRFLPDGRMRVLWRLKPGLRWGDGTPIVAQDMLMGQRRAHRDQAALTVLDPLTVEAIYPSRDPAFLDRFWILPHRVFDPIFAGADGRDAVVDRLRENPPPLDGPYVLKRFTPGVEAVLERNPHFAGRRPILDRVRLVNGADVDSYVADLGGGAVDLGYNNSEPTFARLADAPGLALERFARPTFNRLDFDLSGPPFDDRRTRRAAALAIDRAALSPGGVAPAGYRTPGAPDYDPGLRPPPHAPAAARALLADAGWPDGLEFKLYVFEQRMRTGDRAAIERVEQDLAAAGFRVDRVLYARSSEIPDRHGGAVWRLTTVPAGREGWLWGLDYTLDAASRLETMRARFGDRAAELWRAATESPYAPRRHAASRRLQALFLEETPTVLVSAEDRRTARNPRLRGWRPETVGPSRPFWNIEDWRFAEPADAD